MPARHPNARAGDHDRLVGRRIQDRPAKTEVSGPLNGNPPVFSEIQQLWDLNKSMCRINLIGIGSVYSLMHRIFELDSKRVLEMGKKAAFKKN